MGDRRREFGCSHIWFGTITASTFPTFGEALRPLVQSDQRWRGMLYA